MAWILFTFYLVLFCWFISKLSFFRLPGTQSKALIALFLFKVAAGVAYGYVLSSSNYYQAISDTWKFHQESLKETQLLYHQPWEYFTNLFHNPYEGGYVKFFSTTNSYWNDLKFNSFTKLLSVFNVFSFGHYYTNVIFYAFITFFGVAAFIKTMAALFKTNAYIIMACMAALPSFAFWCSGIHKDGLIFTGLALFIYLFHQAYASGIFTTKKVVVMVLALLLVLPLRNALFIGVVPAVLAWWLAEKFPAQRWWAFAAVVVGGIVIFFNASYLHYKLDLPLSIVTRQQEFMKLGGNSAIPIHLLEPNFISFLQSLPQALNHAFCRPYLLEAKSLFYWPAALEVIAFWLLVALFVLRPKRPIAIPNAVLFCWLVALIILVVIGYTVPYLGAIVRYKSIVLPFLFVPFLGMIDWKKVATFRPFSSN